MSVLYPRKTLKYRLAFVLGILVLLLGVAFALTTSEPLPLPANFTPKVSQNALAYQRAVRTVSLCASVWNLLGLWALFRLGISMRLRESAFRVCHRTPQDNALPPFRVLLLFLFGCLLCLQLWGLPFGLAGRAVESHFGFLRQSWSGYLQDHALNTLLRLFFAPLLWGGYWLYLRSPRHWYLWLWSGATALIALRVVLYPLLLSPLYNNFSPLPDSPLRAKILEIAGRAGITDGRVFVEDTSRRTSHVNAYVTGVGWSARIVLNDTALKTLPEDQLLAMLGHEMGHYVEGHTWVLFFSEVVGAGFFLWLAGRFLPTHLQRIAHSHQLQGGIDLALLPLILLFISLFQLIQSPIASAESRVLERRADAFGLKTTRLREASARLFIGFAERDYVDPKPPRLLHIWFGTHPTLQERIAFSLSYNPQE